MSLLIRYCVAVVPSSVYETGEVSLLTVQSLFNVLVSGVRIKP